MAIIYRMRLRRLIQINMALFIASLFIVFAPPAQANKAAKERVTAGMAALKTGDVKKARGEFDRAIVINPDSVGGYLGQALVALKTGDYAFGFTATDRGMEFANSKKQARPFWPVIVRLHTARASSDWYETVREIYYSSIQLDLDLDSTSDFRLACGQAALKAGDIEHAITHFRVALGQPGQHVAKAQAGLDRAQAVFRASLGKSEIKAVAGKAALTRSDLAVLLFRDFEINSFLPNANINLRRDGEKGADGSTDYGKEDAAKWILAMHRMKLREFSIEKGRYEPKRKVTREEFALLLEDLIIRRYGDKAIARRFIGSASPYPDLPATRGSFNAMVTAISRGLLTANAKGEANPHGALGGADAILALRNLRGLFAD